ncbi:MAG: hypothetical protein PHF00_02975 [Elusimicrobia bacterium]|nr:hypothetical protein [Elusimicrobiota bacterium]
MKVFRLSGAAALASVLWTAGCAMAPTAPAMPAPQCTAAGSGPIEVTGRWQSNLGPVWLSQQDGRVTGQYYDDRRSRLNGILTGTILDFNWAEPGMAPGTGRFVFCPDNLSFTGYWNDAHSWYAVRMDAPPAASEKAEERRAETPWWAEPESKIGR